MDILLGDHRDTVALLKHFDEVGRGAVLAPLGRIGCLCTDWPGTVGSTLGSPSPLALPGGAIACRRCLGRATS